MGQSSIGSLGQFGVGGNTQMRQYLLDHVRSLDHRDAL